MKQLFLLPVLVWILTVSAYGQEKPKSIDAVLSEIRQEQGLTQDQKIDANKVSPQKLEELGDSVMEAMIGNSERHELMDQMMGGEGSDSLRVMHEAMGYRYLSGVPFRGMYGMMGGPYGSARRGGFMMNNGYGYGMMGSYFGLGGWLMGILVILLIGLIIYFAVRFGVGNLPKGSAESSLEILKKRYAKGEITKDEFEKIKKDLLS